MTENRITAQTKTKTKKILIKEYPSKSSNVQVGVELLKDVTPLNSWHIACFSSLLILLFKQIS